MLDTDDEGSTAIEKSLIKQDVVLLATFDATLMACVYPREAVPAMMTVFDVPELIEWILLPLTAK